MKVGDTIRIRKTDITGKILEVINNSGLHFTVKINDYPPIVLYEDEIELFIPEDNKK